ncbi:DUF6209 family protein [Moorena bouillonii]|uniref:Uncharacterized protein n=1 Tax=Moorena bouillonii PNG TaxID=568701 RepID=A0A1U7N6V9_9CYAN|nr:DUF6209 family protein [Moorena bouillonii]OLT61687.1 hypothetical protein BJP37_24335 [Moorena bouillonii PNG]
MMQKLRNALLALVIAIALTWMPSFTVASAQAAEYIPGLQFSIQPGTGDFVQFQSGPISSPKQKVNVFYDSLRLASPANRSCPKFDDLTTVTGHVMSDNSGDVTNFRLNSLSRSAVSYVKVGVFTTPECYYGSEEIQIWFSGIDDYGNICYDSDFGQNYSFPVTCK